MPNLNLIESSGRFDRPYKWLKRSVWQLTTMNRVNVVCGTEAKARNDSFLNRKGWSYAHGSKTENVKRECWMTWKDRVWLKANISVPVISGMSFHRALSGKDTPPNRALRVRLIHKKTMRMVIFYVVHLPTDNTKLRARIWVDATLGLHNFIEHDKVTFPDADIVVVGDINKNFRQRDERRIMEKHIERPNNLRNAWVGNVPRKGGTRGPRGIIDSAFTTLKVLSCRLLRDDRSSDHRPFKTRLRIRKFRECNK